jgi:hypothetical protein
MVDEAQLMVTSNSVVYVLYTARISADMSTLLAVLLPAEYCMHVDIVCAQALSCTADSSSRSAWNGSSTACAARCRVVIAWQE